VTRTLFAGLAASAALFVAAGAQAKAPTDGVDVCGASGSCVHLTMQDAETNWSLWSSPAAYQSALPSVAAPFLIVRWQWPGEAERTAYYVPASGKVRQLDDNGFLSWFDLTDPNSVRTLTAGLEPFPVPQVTRVTVGGRSVRDPGSYLELYGVGSEVFPAILPGWLRIRFTADAPSPWTDGRNDVRISRTGRLLWIDGTMFKIPLQLARRVRARRSLGS